MTFSFLVPNISGNICAASTIQQKEDTTVAVSPFLLLPLLQRLTNHYYKQMHTIRIGTSDVPEAHGSSYRTGTYRDQDDYKYSSTLLGRTC